MIGQALLIGLVQGATEFLPVSSTAHLILVSNWFGWGSFPLDLEMAAHLGTLLAVILFFGRDYWAIVTGRKSQLFWSLFWATVVTAILALLFQPYFDAVQQPLLIALMLAAFGLLLWGVDATSPATKDEADVPTTKQSLLFGLVQAVALLPGVSRSGILITFGRHLKYTREQAARYAFLLSGPIIALSPLDSLLHEGSVALRFDALAWSVLGFSFLFGWLAIKGLMRLVRTTDYRWFAIYRLILAGAIVVSLL